MPEEEKQDNAQTDVEDMTLVRFGDAVKSLGDGKVGGYLVRFSTPDDPDLGGDFFTSDTDYDVDLPGKSTTYFNHGLDPKLGKRRFAKTTLKQDEFGIWAETILKERDEYESFLIDLAKKGKLGWSSGTLSHLVETEPVGKATHITRWPLGLDASLTHIPAEPRNAVMPLKSLSGLPTIITEPESDAEVAESTQSDPVKAEEVPTTTQGEIEMAEVEPTKTVDYEKLVADAAKQGAASAVAEFAAKLTTTNSAGFVEVTQAEEDKPFQNFGSQLAAVKSATLSQGRNLAPRLRALNIKQLGANELVGSEGGFLLEPSFVAELLKPLHDAGPFSSRAAKLAIGPNANGVTVRAIDETSRADGSRWGGIKGYRLAEAGTKLATQPTFRLMELRLKKYAVLCYATEELLQDTTALSGIISQGASEELDFMVNDDILNGAGAGGPLGILNSGALITADAEVGQLADTVVTENIVHMWARMHPRSKGNSVWFINSNVTPQLYLLEFVVGVGGYPAFMGPGSMPNAPSGLLFGRPVVETEFNPTLGDVGDILLADMSQYVMIDKDVQAASSIHVQFLTDQVAFRFVYRCDGQPKISAPLTPYKGTDTIGPFVALEAR